MSQAEPLAEAPTPSHPGAGKGAPLWSGYLAAVLLCGLTLLMRLYLGHAAGDLPMLILFMPPVILAAYLGGLWPGLFCTALAGLLTDLFLIPPLYSLAIHAPKNLVQWLVLMVSGTLVSFLTEALHRARRRSEANEALYVNTLHLLNNILESMPSAIICLDHGRKVTIWNRRAEEMTGLSQLEAVGQPLRASFPWLAERLDVLGLDIDRKGAGVLERQPMQDGQSVKYMDVMGYPVFTNGARGVVLRVDDVTRRVVLEEQMIQSEKMMSVGSLAGGMAHEINNPLSAILQSTQNALRRMDPDAPGNVKAAQEAGCTMGRIRAYLDLREIPSFLSLTKEAGERAARIVRNMLGFIRKSSSAHIPASLPEIMDRILELASTDYDLKKRFDFKRIEIVREYQQPMPPVMCSPSEMEQVMFNLVSNAAQALAEGEGESPRITVRARKENGMAVFEVEDNGPGMTEPVKRKAFDPLFTTKPPGLGTGLGLAISYFIVTNNHNGSITIDSAPGKGARVTVRLPQSS